MQGRTEILWCSDAFASAERCVIADVPGRSCIESTTELWVNNNAATVACVVHTNTHWHTISTRAAIDAGADSRTIEMQRTAAGWTVDGIDRPDLHACTTVDLGWSPATNTLALRARPIAIGESATSTAAWLRFPELDVVASEQTYTRLAADRVRYRSATFTADLVVNSHDIVTVYGDGLWRAETVRHVG